MMSSQRTLETAFVALFVQLSWAPSANADEVNEASTSIEDIVVTGSRTERPLSETPVATEVISRDELDQSGAETLADILEEHPALYVQRSFAGSGVQLQGLDPDYTLILVDGQRTTGRIGGVNDLTRIPAEDIERIEIVRGSGSALYGSDAIGGVINIITRRNRKSTELSGRMGYGNRNLFDATVLGGLQAGPWNTRLSVGFHRGDGFDLEPDDAATNGVAFDQINVGNQTQYRVSDQTSVTFAGEYLYRDQNAINESGGGAIMDRANRTETLSTRLSVDTTFDSPVKLKLWTGYSMFRDQFLQDQRGSTVLDQVQDTREHLGQGGVQLDAMLGQSHFASIGVEGFYQRLASERLGPGMGERGRGAVYLQDEWTLLDDGPRLVIVGGARLDLDSQFGVNPTPRIALRFDPIEKLVVRASFGLGFRAPNFRELLLSFQNPSAGYVVEGNPDLDPESSRSFNMGVEYKPIGGLWLSVNVFRNELDNMILTDLADDGGAGGAQVFQYANVTSARTQGTELAIRWRPIAELMMNVGYTYLYTLNQETDRPLVGRPTHRATASLRYQHRTWGTQAMLRSALVGEQPFFQDTDGNGVSEETPADAYATIDVRIEQSLGDHLSVFLLAENLLDAGDPRFLAIQPRTITGGAGARY